MLIRARWLLPIVAPPLENGAVVARGSDLAAVGRSADLRARFPAEPLLDLGEAALLPGFVNAHSHLDYTALRGLLDDLPFVRWIRELTRLRREVMTDAELLSSARWGAIEALRSGVTTLADTSASGAACRAMSALGLRGIAYQETFGLDDADAAAGERRLLEGLERLHAWASPLVRPGVHAHAPYTVGPALFRACARVAREGRLPLSVHLAESAAEVALLADGGGELAGWARRFGPGWRPPGSGPVRYLDALGVLEARPLLAHLVQADDTDAALLAREGASVAHCPKSNAKFGHGIAPLAALRRAGVAVGLGSDGMGSNDVMDPFEEMRAAALLARAREREFAALSAAEALELATLGGARALGLADEIGSLEAGKRADLTGVALTGAHLAPLGDPCAALVFAAHQTDVCFTMVHGRVLFDGARVTSADEAQARREIVALGQTLARARGAPPPAP